MWLAELADNVYQIDVHDQEPERTSCYLIVADQVALIETGATPGTVHIRKALEKLDLPPQRVNYIILTHIHLDHAGGAGAMAEVLPRARLYVHPRGARHLIDPTRLIAATKAIYGQKYDQLFGRVLPVLPERIHTPANGETLDLGGGRMLQFHYAPGHAGHHFIIHDPASRGIFSGDALGVRFKALSHLMGFNSTMPSTPPPEFDPLQMVETFDQAARLKPEYIYFAHFGRAEGAMVLLEGLKEQVGSLVAVGRSIHAAGGGAAEIEKAIWDLVMKQVAVHGLTDQGHPLLKFMAPDIRLNAAGINHYLGRDKGASNRR
ncbi:MAG: MBL fold metallo-hydrolase [Peptococcaceae bacterium]|nr:MBL fold metallo-hydrolase [Candidatus Syntrophopropionicum ammoniitolerans]